MLDKGMIPADPLRDVFTSEVLEKLRSQKNPGQTLLRRIEVLTAKGPEPSDPRRRENFRTLRKLKAAWEAYLTAAFATGLFEGKDGNDLRSRLRSPDDENFHSAIAECMAIWFLARKLRHSVYTRPIDRKGPLEFCIRYCDEDIHVEVKAPYPAIADKVMFSWGDGSDILRKTVKAANEQFGGDVRNLLIIKPHFLSPVYTGRRQITRAFFGSMKIKVPIDLNSGGPAVPNI